VYEGALAELRAGHKTGHWMWFVFPQVQGLGSSPTAQRYAISGLQEARAYLADPVLGSRLAECCDALLGLEQGESAETVLGGIDALKLRSCVTLFLRAGAADGSDRVLEAVLDRFYGGEPDAATDRLLAQCRVKPDT
jgi:uncharacterized protein (DUF1810 family)